MSLVLFRNLLIVVIAIGFVSSCVTRESRQTQRPVEPHRYASMVDKTGTNELNTMIEEVDLDFASTDPMDDDPDDIAPPPPAKVHKDLPLEVNDSVKKWIHFFTVKDHERFQRFLDRGERYREMITKVLQDLDVPPDIFYLAMIESGFAVHARSHASAVGVWQFIRGTGKRYGLRIDHYVDERKDPVRATVAAAAYLKDLHNVFQIWLHFAPVFAHDFLE